MTWMKRIQPGEKVPLKLTQAERTLVVEQVTCLPPEHEEVIKRTPPTEPVLFTLDDLDDLGGHVAAESNHCSDRKTQTKLDAVFGKIEHLLNTYTDDERAEAAKQAKQKIAKAMTDRPSGKKPEIVSFRIKAPKKPDSVYPVKLTEQERESICHCTRLKRSVKQKIEAVADGTQVVSLTRKELDVLDKELGEAAVFAPSPYKKRLLAVQHKIADFLDDERSTRRRAPAKKSDLIFQFKITLAGIKPPIWRRIQIRDCTLGDLHDVIQVAMGWEDYHLHQFVIAGDRFGPPIPDDPDYSLEVKDENRVVLSKLLPRSAKRTRWLYEYDFGDGWQHEILFEGYPSMEKGKKYPLCLEGERACPPEDCGGPWGYADFLKAIADPKHEQHEELLEWIGGEFDAEEFNLKAVNAEMRTVRR